MILKDYQDDAVRNLQTKLYRLWKGGYSPARLVFKAPTGAGKTVIAAELLSRIAGDAQFNPDKAFIWFSFNPDNVEQSQRSLHRYLNGGVASLYDTDEMSARGKLNKNDVLFVNWQKLATRRAGRLRLRQDGEATISFDTFVRNTQADGREIIVIIDECHLAASSTLAKEILALIRPRLALHISATPTDCLPSLEEHQAGRADQVTITREPVVASGVLKRTIRIMPREAIAPLVTNGHDLDHTILEIAAAKRAELAAAYKAAGAHVNPLVLIKLPNDDAQAKAAVGDTMLATTKRTLAALGVPDHKIAIWLTAKKENLATITANDSTIDYLIFKQAAATGWDCPRADVIVMFREIKNPVFETQILGRVLRTAEGKHYDDARLNDAYLFTSYERATIETPPVRGGGANAPKTAIAWRKDTITNLALPSVYITRADYNDLGDSFQDTFTREADRYFGITTKDTPAAMLKKLDGKGLNRSQTHITNRLIVDANIEVFDDFIADLANNVDELDHEASYLDRQKLYTTLLWRELTLQDDPDCRYAPARSWADLKSALNVYFRDKLNIPNPPLHAVLCNDLQKAERSALRPLITRSLKAYRPRRSSETASRAQSLRKATTFTILDSYELAEDTPLFTIKTRPPKRYALNPAFIAFDSDLERQFAAFLDTADIDWWYKNGAGGADDLGIPYLDGDGSEHVFYPDFVVRKGNRVGIFDTTIGNIAESDNRARKAVALADYIATTSSDLKLWGGIVTLHSGMWKFHNGRDYTYDDALEAWQPLAL